MDYDLDNRIIKVDVDNDEVEKYRRLVGILDLVSEANVARRVSSREAAANQVQIYNASSNQVATTQIDNHILWNTRRRDELTGYYLYKFRHYSAELGRWLARDPIEENSGVNLYAFVGNDPVGRWDLLGNITQPLQDLLNENLVLVFRYCVAESKCLLKLKEKLSITGQQKGSGLVYPSITLSLYYFCMADEYYKNIYA